MPLDRAAADALGRRLERSRSSVSAEDLEALSRLQTKYVPHLELASARLTELLGAEPMFEGVELTATSRVKTVATIVQKLQRHETRLSRMRDVVGIRIVGSLLRSQQRRLAVALSECFGGAEIVDRVAAPNFGYRALHVIPEIDGYPVEIQVRTDLQHNWANTMELLADLCGRQVRYGGPPEASSEKELIARTRVLEEHERGAEIIARCEDVVDAHLALFPPRSETGEQARPAPPAGSPGQAGGAPAAVEDALADLRAHSGRMHDLILALQADEPPEP